MRTIFRKILKVYYWVVSPWLGTRCRFVPSCSEYADRAYAQHGVLTGSLLTAKRICRCHPWGGSGYDPVPLAKDETKSSNVMLNNTDK